MILPHGFSLDDYFMYYGLCINAGTAHISNYSNSSVFDYFSIKKTNKVF